MKLAVVAGEASGDLHASALVHELRRLDPGLSLFGIGGDRLAAEGMRLVRHARDVAIVGLFNVVRHLPMFLSAFRDMKREIERERPDAVLLVDFPDFNLRVARAARRMGVPVVYYISPQIWAWRSGRVRQIAERVDQMIVVFPFEKEFYDRHGVNVAYVGHPLVDQLGGITPRGVDPPGVPLRVALLPGSRRMEVGVLLRPMLEGVAAIRRTREVDARLLIAPTIDREPVDALIAEAGVEATVVQRGRMEALAACDVSICSSGTATLESAVLGVPPIVVYRLPPLTYAVARRLVRVPQISLVNIVAGREIVPELLQRDVRGERIASEVLAMAEPGRWSRARADVADVRAKLGEGGASRKAAEKIVTLVGQGRPSRRSR
ncbi:MAG: lipid-A-disaccharide synthase [Thermoanaerobaculia bacterium]